MKNGRSKSKRLKRLVCPAFAAPAFVLIWCAIAARQAPAQPAPNADTLFAAAEDAYRSRAWRKAADQFDAIAAEHRNEPMATEARFYAAEALMQLSEFAAARDQFQAILAEGAPPRLATRAEFRLAEAAYFRDDLTTAINRFSLFTRQHADDPLTARALEYLGDAFLRQGDAEQAIKALRQCIALSPPDNRLPDCFLRIAIAQIKTGDVAAAKETFAKWDPIVGRAASRWKSVNLMAKSAFAAKEFEWAAELFDEMAHSGGPKTIVAAGEAGLAWSRFRMTEADASAADFEQLLAKHPNDNRAAGALLARGYLLEQRGAFDSALANFQRVWDDNPASPAVPDALVAAAQLHKKLDRRDDARRLFRRTIKEFSSHRVALEASYQLGWMSQRAGDLDSADAEWHRIRKQPGSDVRRAEATYLLAENAASRGEFGKAKKWLAEWFGAHSASDPTNQERQAFLSPTRKKKETLRVQALYLQAQIAIAEKAWSDVVPPLAQLVTESPESALRLPAQFWIAEANFRSGALEAAQRQFNQLALLVAGRDFEWMAMIPLRRAQLLLHDGDRAEALHLAQSIDAEYPDFRLAHEVDSLIGQCYSGSGEMDAARDAYRRVVRSPFGKKTETAAMAQWMIGETYMHQQNYVEALREYLRVEKYSEFPEWRARAALQAGVCYERLDRWGEAAQVYRLAAGTFRDTDVGRQIALRNENANRRRIKRTQP